MTQVNIKIMPPIIPLVPDMLQYCCGRPLGLWTVNLNRYSVTIYFSGLIPDLARMSMLKEFKACVYGAELMHHQQEKNNANKT